MFPKMANGSPELCNHQVYNTSRIHQLYIYTWFLADMEPLKLSVSPFLIDGLCPI